MPTPASPLTDAEKIENRIRAALMFFDLNRFGTDQHFDGNSEPVTFRGAEIMADVKDDEGYGKELQTDAPRRATSLLSVKASDVAGLTPATAPIRGEFFLDGYGSKHVITHVKFIRTYWHCHCTKTNPE